MFPLEPKLSRIQNYWQDGDHDDGEYGVFQNNILSRKCRCKMSSIFDTSSRWISSVLAGEVVSDFSFARTKVTEAEIKELSYVVDCFSWLRRRPGRADSSFSWWERYTEEISKGMRSAIAVNKLSTRLSFDIVLIGFLSNLSMKHIKTMNYD